MFTDQKGSYCVWDRGSKGEGKGNKAGTRQWPDDTSLVLLSGGMKANAGFSEEGWDLTHVKVILVREKL